MRRLAAILPLGRTNAAAYDLLVTQTPAVYYGNRGFNLFDNQQQAHLKAALRGDAVKAVFVKAKALALV